MLHFHMKYKLLLMLLFMPLYFFISEGSQNVLFWQHLDDFFVKINNSQGASETPITHTPKPTSNKCSYKVFDILYGIFDVTGKKIIGFYILGHLKICHIFMEKLLVFLFFL